MHRYVGTRSAVTKFEGVEAREAIRFVSGLIKTPERLVHHIRVQVKFSSVFGIFLICLQFTWSCYSENFSWIYS